MDITWVEVISVSLILLTQWAAHIGKPEFIIGVKILSKAWDIATGNTNKAENER